MRRTLTSAGWIALTVALLALVGIAVAGLAAGEAIETADVTIDDPDNQTVEVHLDFSGLAEVDIELLDEDDEIADNTTVSEDSGTHEVVLSVDEAGDYTLNVTADEPDNVDVTQTLHVSDHEVEVTDAGNETVVVDIDFAMNASATITIYDEADSQINQTEVDNEDGEALLTTEFTDEDGIVDGNLTVTVSVSPAEAYEAVYVEVDDGSGFFGGTIFGQDVSTVLVVVVLAGVGWMLLRRD